MQGSTLDPAYGPIPTVTKGEGSDLPFVCNRKVAAQVCRATAISERRRRPPPAQPVRMKCQRRSPGSGAKTSGAMRSAKSRSSDESPWPRAARSRASAASTPALLM